MLCDTCNNSTENPFLMGQMVWNQAGKWKCSDKAQGGGAGQCRFILFLFVFKIWV